MFYEKDIDTFFKYGSQTANYNGGNFPVLLEKKLESEVLEEDVVQVYEIFAIAKTSDVQGIKNNDIISIDGIQYKVIERNENFGITTLYLGEI